MLSPDRAKRLGATALELLVAVFLLGLILSRWIGPGEAAANAGTASPALLPFQGTPVVATINGSIDGTEATFPGQRHFRSGLPGDTNCQLFGVSGNRFFDQVLFVNDSSTSQKVNVTFTASCGANTYMAAFSPSFAPGNICAGYLAGAGVSGDVSWDFSVCAGTQFSIVVYGLEPGVLCAGYSYTVQANGVSLIGPATPTSVVRAAASQSTSAETEPFARTDIQERRKLKRAARALSLAAASTGDSGSSGSSSGGPVLAAQGTPLAAIINGSINGGEPVISRMRHLVTGIRGDTRCTAQVVTGNRLFDEVLFLNTSPVPQRVSIGFTSSCGIAAYIAAYSPQFDPTDLCRNFVAQAGVLGNSNFDFVVCPNSQFSLVVYSFFGGTCSGYSYQVFGEGITVKFADIAVTKTVGSGGVAVGSDLAYLINVANIGPFPAANVTVTDPLPAGTTFQSLTALLPASGTPLPAPVCSTPPIGSGGTITCSLPILGTPLQQSLTFALVARVTSGGGPITNIATAGFPGMDTNPANNVSSATVGVFNKCAQSESAGLVFQFNSTTGEYMFTSCTKGLILSGRGVLSSASCKLTLTDTGPDSKKPDRKVSLLAHV